MRVVIVGAGAVGSLLGWALARGGAEVSIVRRSHVGGPAAGEIVVAGPGTGRRVPRSTVEVSFVGAPADLVQPPDVAVLAVRQYDLEAAVASLAPFPDATVVTAQNGVGAEEVVAAAWPRGSVVAASVTASVDREADGTVRWLRRGGVGLAVVRGGAADMDPIVAAFGRSGLPARRYPDAASMKWSKLVANLVGNATSALLDMDPAAIYADPVLFALERAQLREALAVMTGRHVRVVNLPGASVRLLAVATVLPGPLGRLALSRAVRRGRGGKDPSLRLALRAGEPRTEVAWLNGAVDRAATEAGMRARVNARLAALVDEAATDPDRRAFFAGRPDRLVEAFRAER